MKLHDDFNWDSYTKSSYETQLMVEINKNDNIDLLISSVDRDANGDIVFKDNLHPNWMKLYHTVDKLKVNSAFECGCGSVQHLINLRKLNPEIVLRGCDYAQSQIDLGYKYFDLSSYDFAPHLEVRDLTKDIPEDHPKFEFVYTQAVTMHLAHTRAMKFLQNMGRMSSKYIFLIENINSHNYPALLAQALPDFELISLDSKYSQVHAMALKRKDSA